jgi:hypothetical protein
MQFQTDDELWRLMFKTLDTIGSPSLEADSAADIHLYFLSGIDAKEKIDVSHPWDNVAWHRRPSCQPRKLPEKVSEYFIANLQELGFSYASPGLGLITIIALWRDAHFCDDEQSLEAFRNALSERVLNGGRCDFELPLLWVPAEDIIEEDPPADFDGPFVHARLFDVTNEAYLWVTERLATGRPVPASLPPVSTPDADLRSLIAAFRARSLVDERHYWGVESGGECIVLVEEADHSRRLLRDYEGRAGRIFAWGDKGTRSYALAGAIVADMLGTLAYCPSCFGAIPAGGGLVECPTCDGSGLRQKDLKSLHRACFDIIAELPELPDPSLQDSQRSPLGAQWRMARTELLERALQLADELDRQDASHNDPGDQA